MHPHAHKVLTYYTVTGFETLRVYNLTDGRAPSVIQTPDGRAWRRRGLVLDLPEDFELAPGDYFLTPMTMQDAQVMAAEIVEVSWDIDPELRRLYETPEEMRAVILGGLVNEIDHHRAPVLCHYK